MKHSKLVISYESNGVKGYDLTFPHEYYVKERILNLGISLNNIITLKLNGITLNKEEIADFIKKVEAATMPRAVNNVVPMNKRKGTLQNNTKLPDALFKQIHAAGLNPEEWVIKHNSIAKMELIHISTGELKELAV